MRRAAALLLLGLLAACAARPLPGIGEQDGRSVVDIEAAPWRSLGVVSNSRGGRCTGALVGPHTMLTAAHCLLDPRTGQLLEARNLQVVLGLSPANPGQRIAVVSYVTGTGFRARPGPTPDPAVAPDTDWALLALDPAMPAVPSDRHLTFAPGFARNGTPLAFGGYQADRPNQLVADLGCQVMFHGRDPGGHVMLRHSCSATSGSSGGPLLVRLGDGVWTVAGVGSMALNTAGGGWAVPAITIRRAIEAAIPKS
jgi:protease YdgD